jgi:diphosphomevalonate decarboxylase
MAALALCLTDIENALDGGLRPHEFFEKASMIARLGSGSACRSLFPYLSVWGKHTTIPFSSNEHGIPFHDTVHPVFKTFKDAILIVSSDEKSVSSRAGTCTDGWQPVCRKSLSTSRNASFGSHVESLKEGNLEKFG